MSNLFGHSRAGVSKTKLKIRINFLKVVKVIKDFKVFKHPKNLFREKIFLSYCRLNNYAYLCPER